ncbi:GspH/FimT family pseudopilin [Stratiformator vulcanicus]|uniref:Type II secretion system protein H n=1 Tax=Stratiformator vulcanicus TaxID=2527980 RepID=A0A517R518_9PLAN|nr:GspH/FimT family pseudopilin [Stratiformator vulcanicus]QDT38974.1 hypothetical protein Pan189_33740 [Stratiformator vulcanicus]
MRFSSRIPISRRAFTLIELVIVIGLIAVAATLAITSAGAYPGRHAEIAAKLILTDLRLARSLAIHHNAQVVVAFDSTANRYSISAAGGSTIDLPTPQLGAVSGEAYTIDLDQVCKASLAGAMSRQSESLVSEVVFQPDGGASPDRAEDTVVWIVEQGSGGARFVRLRICWVTGEVWPGGPWVWDSNARTFLTADEP